MFKKFYPTFYMDSTYSIDFDAIYKEGYRGIIFDIDNTLVPHGADADDRAKKLMKHLQDIGFQVCFISNNNEERVKRFNQEINAKYVYKANKPSVKNYKKAMEFMNTNTANTIFVGDQLFTDVYGANRSNLRSYLVKPIDKHEEIQIVLKRKLEKIVLYFYKKTLKVK